MHTIETAITVPLILISFIVSIGVSCMVVSLVSKQSSGYCSHYCEASSVRTSEIVRITEVTYETFHNITSKATRD